MSKNAISISQTRLLCRHFREMTEAGFTENLAIRQVELASDVYAKYRKMRNTTPHYAGKVELWSKAALSS